MAVQGSTESLVTRKKEKKHPTESRKERKDSLVADCLPPVWLKNQQHHRPKKEEPQINEGQRCLGYNKHGGCQSNS